MIRRIRKAWRWLTGRRFAVVYDPADVQWYVDWHGEEAPRYTDTLARSFGADEQGHFRSRRRAQAFLDYLGSRHGYEYPILPNRITTIWR